MNEQMKSSAHPPRASIIMRSKNSDWVIGEALAGLFSQDCRDFELVVVDSGSTDRTLELVRQYPHRLIEIEPGDYFPGQVLNDAIATTSSEIIVCQNSDAVPLTSSTLGHLLAAFDDPKVDAALGRQLPRPEAHGWVRREYAESFPDAPSTPEWITLSLPLAAIRRSAWEMHPFYTDAWGSEDTEWGAWAKRSGRQVRYVPEALVMHSHNYTLKQLYGRRFIEGEADCFIYGGRETLPTMVLRTLAATARDIKASLTRGDWLDLSMAPARRAVSHWAYYRGSQHGFRRKREGSTDVTFGQRVVLDRHESNR